MAEMPEDELVLIDGELRTPEWVSKMASKVFSHDSQYRRYRCCYIEHDKTTPTFEEFRRNKKPRGKRN